MKNKFFYSLPAIALFLLCLGLEGCETATARRGGIPTPTPTPFVEDIAVQCLNRSEVAFLVDKTQSPSEDLFKNQSAKIREALLKLCPRKVTVVNFGEDGFGAWHAQEQAIEFEASPVNKEFNESLARTDATKLCGARKNCLDKEVENQRRDFDDRYADSLLTFKTSIEKSIERVVVEILKPPVKEPSCTDLNEVASRTASTSAAVVYVLTDGKHDCSTQFETVNFPAGKKVIVLLMPLASEHPGNSFRSRMELIKKKYQNAVVLPLNSVSAEKIVTTTIQSETR